MTNLLDKAVYIGSTQLNHVQNKTLNHAVNFPENEAIFWDMSNYIAELGFSNTASYDISSFQSLSNELSKKLFSMKKFFELNGVLILFSTIPEAVFTRNLGGWSHVEGVNKYLSEFGVKESSGKQVVYCGPDHVDLGLDKLSARLSYSYTLEAKNVEPLFKVARSDQTVGAYTYPKDGGIIMMVPNPRGHFTGSLPEQEQYIKVYCNQLIRVGKILIEQRKSTSKETPDAPKWEGEYKLPKEAQYISEISDFEEKIKNLQNEITVRSTEIDKCLDWKKLFYAYDDPLEDQIQFALQTLGAKVEKGPKSGNEADLIANWKDTILVIEVKGLKNGAKTGNVSQCKKWVEDVHCSYSLEEEEREPVHQEYRNILEKLGFDLNMLDEECPDPKGILALNTFREKKLSERIDQSFADNVKRNLKAKEICGVTSLQILGAVLSPKTNHSGFLDDLVDTKGQIEKFNDYTKFLITEDAEDSPKKAANSA